MFKIASFGEEIRMEFTQLKMVINGCKLEKEVGIRPNLGIASGNHMLMKKCVSFSSLLGTTLYQLCRSFIGERYLSQQIVLDVKELLKKPCYTVLGIVTYLDRCGSS